MILLNKTAGQTDKHKYVNIISYYLNLSDAHMYQLGWKKTCQCDCLMLFSAEGVQPDWEAQIYLLYKMNYYKQHDQNRNLPWGFYKRNSMAVPELAQLKEFHNH